MKVFGKWSILLMILIGFLCFGQDKPMVMRVKFTETSFPWGFTGSSNFQYTTQKVGTPTVSPIQTGTDGFAVDEVGEYLVSILPPSGNVSVNTSVLSLNNPARENILELTNWGDIKWASVENLFYNAIQLGVSATDIPNLTNVSSLARMFYNCNALTEVPGINNWDTSHVTNISYMFQNAIRFNQDLSFNTSNVTNMFGVFFRASAFNKSVSFDTSNVTLMDAMFFEATKFNQALDFNTSKVTSMTYMFSGATAFNRPLAFDTSNVVSMEGMFGGATKFNQNLGGFTLKPGVFMAAFAVNSGISCFNLSNTLKKWAENPLTPSDIEVDFGSINYRSEAQVYYNQLLAKNWEIVSGGVDAMCGKKPLVLKIDFKETSFPWAFVGANDFQYTTQKVGESTVSAVKTGTNSFIVNTIGEYIVSITPPSSSVELNTQVLRINDPIRRNILELKNWGDVNWYSMEALFQNASRLILSATDKPNLMDVYSLSRLFANCESLITVPNINSWETGEITDMSSMFENAKTFNQTLSFDTGSVTSMYMMFSGAQSLNQPLRFDTSKVISMARMFSGASTFNQPLIFDTSKVVDMSYMFSGASIFNLPLAFDTSAATDMSYMFHNATAFNQPLWFNTSYVENMTSMFTGAVSFNQLLAFNTSKVVNMNWMFREAIAFNQPLAFNTSNVKSMVGMFFNASAYNQPITFDTSTVTNMELMFMNASVFNQNLGNLKLNSVVNTSPPALFVFAEYSGIDCVNYGKTLKGWAENNLTPNNIIMNFGSIAYGTDAVQYRNQLIEKGWSLKDGGLNSSCDSFLGTDVEMPSNDVFIYPNPATNEVNFVAEQASKVQVYSANGQLIKEIYSTKGGNKLNVSSLPNGVYILKIGHQTSRFIKK